MRDLIFVSMENWDEIWRRNQFVVAELARRFPTQKILFVGLSRDFSHALRKRKWRELKAEKLVPIPDSPNVYLTRAPKWLPNTIPLCRKINGFVMRRHIRKTAKKLGIEAPILWFNPHSAVHMMGKMNERGAIYDITDDWTQLTQKPGEKTLVIAQDKLLCRRADAVIVCSERLYELKKPLARRLFLVPNGVDAAHYANVDNARRADAAAPVFGYTGTLHADRVDLNRVLDLARAFPNGRVVLVGPNLLPQNATEKLRAQPNIEVRGAVPYAQIPQIMSSFDVCVVPHLENAFTQSLNPIKLWEYLAAGKPIVTTNVAGFCDYPQFCHVASSREDFLEACREAVAEAAHDDLTQVEARRREAANHSWTCRVDDIIRVLDLIG